MDFVAKKTTELTTDEVVQICDVFNKTFEGHSTLPKEFLLHYSNTPIGYSFHSLMISDGKVVGVHNNVPYYYIYQGERCLFAYGGGTMVLKGYRDFFNFMKLYKVSEKYALEEGVSYLFGFPNENSHILFVKGFRHRDLTPLNIYITPLRVGSVKPSLKRLNLISMVVSRFMLWMSNFSLNRNVTTPLVSRDRATFTDCRFRSKKYLKIHGEGYEAVYAVSVQNGVKTAFLLDVFPMSPYTFNSAVRAMFTYTKEDNVGLLMYVGYLPFVPLSMLKLPSKLAPKNFYFTGLILDKNKIDDRIYKTNNWEVSLADYDLI